MRGSAPQTPEYSANLAALPLIGSIRWFGSSIALRIGVGVKPDNTGDDSLRHSASTLSEIPSDAFANPRTMNLHQHIMRQYPHGGDAGNWHRNTLWDE